MCHPKQRGRDQEGPGERISQRFSQLGPYSAHSKESSCSSCFPTPKHWATKSTPHLGKERPEHNRDAQREGLPGQVLASPTVEADKHWASVSAKPDRKVSLEPRSSFSQNKAQGAAPVYRYPKCKKSPQTTFWPVSSQNVPKALASIFHLLHPVLKTNFLL